MKVGDKITMYFKFAGVVSEEKLRIMNLTETTLELEEETSYGEYRTFDRITGECLNDNTYLGAQRYIKPI